MFKPARWRALVGAVLAFGLVVTPASAMRVQPMSYDLTPSGRGATQDIRVENTNATPMPVEIRVERRHIGLNGEETREPAEDDFLVFPPQGIVPPNGFQNFRVQYIGDPALTQTALYVITVAQLPVNTTGAESSGVQFLFNLGTSVAVSPEGSTADVQVTSVEPAAEANKLRVTVTNRGNRYARLHNGSWTFTTAGGASETLIGEDLRAAVSQPLIEPGATRIIELPVSERFVREGASARFEYVPITSGR
ncbi:MULTISPECIES: molecular chaperone [Brevundimonas]|uniref:fimbrial biogenesis chaperone n=1 Tax=Brevundimonas TaxID=41275 RepID=UPI0013CF0099|nr:fimbria/pilus periplasmic chaperone [Brevundimonas lutea]